MDFNFSESEGRVWKGRPAFTETSPVFLVRKTGERYMRKISTTVIQGDRDRQGRAFSQLTSVYG